MSFIRVALLSTSLLLAANLSGCYGKFQLTRDVDRWNGSLGNIYINTVVLWLFMVIPVYGLIGLADFWILNVIEFWTGKNPLLMQNGEIEEKIVKKDGKTFRIVATKYQMQIEEVGASDSPGVTVVYNEKERCWYALSGDKKIKMAAMTEGEKIEFYNFEGNSLARLDVPAHVE